MCVVLDACCANSLANPEYPQSRLILDWVRGGGKIASGGKLQVELGKTALRPLLAQWSASGRLILIPQDAILAEELAVQKTGARSNDAHVIAVARISSSKVVVTRDDALIADLKDRAIMGDKRKIFPMPARPVVDLRIGRGVLRQAACT